MARPIKLKINYSRIVLDHLYHGKNGQYLDLVAWPNKNGPDQYGNTHMVCQELSREAREAGVKGAANECYLRMIANLGTFFQVTKEIGDARHNANGTEGGDS